MRWYQPWRTPWASCPLPVPSALGVDCFRRGFRRRRFKARSASVSSFAAATTLCTARTIRRCFRLIMPILCQTEIGRKCVESARSQNIAFCWGFRPPFLAAERACESAQKAGKCAYRRGLGGAFTVNVDSLLHSGQRSVALGPSGYSCSHPGHVQNTRVLPAFWPLSQFM